MKKLIATIDQDTDYSLDDTWEVITFIRGYPNFQEPLKYISLPNEWGEVDIIHPGMRRRFDRGLAYLLSVYRHSAEYWWIRGHCDRHIPDWQWDVTEFAGLLYWPHGSRAIGIRSPQKRLEAAKGFMKAFNAYMNGNVYTVTVTDEDGRFVDGCSGFISIDEIAEFVKEAAKDNPVRFQSNVLDVPGLVEVYEEITNVP